MAQLRLLALSAALLVLVLNVAEYGTMSMELPSANQTTAALMAESQDELDRQGASSAPNVIYIAIRIQVSNGCSTAGRCGGLSSGRCNSYCDNVGYNHYDCTPHYCKCCHTSNACD